MGVCMPGLCVIACVTCVMQCDVDHAVGTFGNTS